MAVEKPVFVLVHSPLVGPLTWTLVADALRARGHEVIMPRLDNPDATVGTLLHHHAEQVRQAVEARTRTAPVVLVGHSGAGAVLPAAGDTLVNPVAAYVFVDAAIPVNRATRFDDAPPDSVQRIRGLAEGGRVPPWAEWWSEAVLKALLPDDAMREQFAAELEPLPLRLFDEPITVPASFPDAPCGYVLLSAAYDDAAAAASRRGWAVVGLEAGHLHMLVAPNEVAVALETLATDLRGDDARGRALHAQADPIAAQRARYAAWADAGRRVGFSALALAVLLFGVALYWDLPAWTISAIIGCLVVASISLLPSMVIGYGVAAADREDRDRGQRPSS